MRAVWDKASVKISAAVLTAMTGLMVTSKRKLGIMLQKLISGSFFIGLFLRKRFSK